MKKLVLIICLVLGAAVFATPTISDLKVTTVEPLAFEIVYEVSGAEAGDASRELVLKMVSGETTYTAKSVTGATVCTNGAHQICWDLTADGITLGKGNVSVTVEYKAVAPLYCVIDLSAGSSAEKYTVTYLDQEPEGGFNRDEYKTTKLVLKRVEAGTFTMGDADEEDNLPHEVTLTKSFYMGLFEMTQKQWNLVMGTTPWTANEWGSGDTYPAYCISYNKVRGSGYGSKWPASDNVDMYSSFIGKMRNRTGIRVDLPTEAQWEYTCKAGRTTKYSYGDTASDEYMWTDYDGMSSHEVGLKKANDWGFYDMHGNIAEWCLDWWDESQVLSEDSVDPKGATSATEYRMIRGGSWAEEAALCASSLRNGCEPASDAFNAGFRLAGPEVEASGEVVSATVTVSGVTSVDPVPEVEEDDKDKIAAALEGSADGRLATYLTDLEKYKKYRAWVDTIAGSGEANFSARQAVKDSGLAWFAYALDLGALPDVAPTSLEIVGIASGTDKAWDLVVSVDGVTIGVGADGANLGTVFRVVGAADLGSEFKAENVTVTFSAVDGKLKAEVQPVDTTLKQFFMRVEMVP